MGEICGKGLKQAGYCVFGYREYMSLIIGGHSSYQIDVSYERVESSEVQCDIIMNFNHYGFEQHHTEVKDGGIFLHQTPMWKFTNEQNAYFAEHNITVMYLPVEEMLKKLKAPQILSNMYITSIVWMLLGQSAEVLKELVQEQFGHKGEKIVQKNYECIEEGMTFLAEHPELKPVEMMQPDPKWKECLYLTGSEAIGLGLIHAGCRMYTGYPMTPASPLLKYLAEMQNKTGMIIKQAEDEITAVQMASGAMLMGTRAATGTSGGGFDLMTETISLNGIIENPLVVFLFQRQGPSTGLPTWTGQGDLHLAVGAAHGEFPRLVLGVSDAQDGFDLMPEAFNYAEEFQTVVIIVADKQIAEGLYTQEPYDLTKAEIRRGNLVTDPAELEKLTSADRYNPAAKDGVSPRWLPGAKAATYCAQGDEHDAEGNVSESGENAIAQMEKRMAKMEALKKALPDPDVYGEQKSPDVLLVSWGSNASAIHDALKHEAFTKKKIAYVHYSYLWPLKTEKLHALAKKAKTSILIESNYQGQLGRMIRQECGLAFDHQILKYDGRPFFYNELVEKLSSALS